MAVEVVLEPGQRSAIVTTTYGRWTKFGSSAMSSRPKTVTKPCSTVAGRVTTALVMPNRVDRRGRSVALRDVAHGSSGPLLARLGRGLLGGLTISLDVFASPER